MGGDRGDKTPRHLLKTQSVQRPGSWGAAQVEASKRHRRMTRSRWWRAHVGPVMLLPDGFTPRAVGQSWAEPGPERSWAVSRPARDAWNARTAKMDPRHQPTDHVRKLAIQRLCRKAS